MSEPPATLWELWEYRPNPDEFSYGTLSSPVVGDEYVFVVDGLHRVYAQEPSRGTVIALDPRRSEPAWQTRLETPPTAAPTLARGAVIVPQRDGTVRAFDQADGTDRWRYRLGGQPATPTVAEGWLYVGDTEGTVHALALDGKSCWTVEQGPRLEGFGFGQRPSAQYKVAVDEETVYALFTPHTEGDTPERGRLVALSREDGSERWRYPFTTDHAQPRAPVVDPDTETVLLPGGRTLHAIDTADGSERWRYTFGSQNPVSTPAVGDGRVYVCNKNTYALDLADGSEIWRFVNTATGRVLTDRHPLVSAPVVAGETVYVGLGALDAATGTPRWGEFGNQADSAYFSASPSGGLAVPGPALSPSALYVSLRYGGLVRFGRERGGAQQ